MPSSTTESGKNVIRAEASDDKRQKRKDTIKKSKQKAKRLKLDPPIEWGDYNPAFPTSGSAGKLELYDFLQRLEKVSTFAKTRTDATARLLAKLRKSSKLDILIKLDSELPNFPQDDVILLTDAQSLEDALSRPFRIPLLHRATTNHPSLGPCTNFGIDDFCKHLADDKDASISVYDYSVEDPLQRTRKTTVHELLSCFLPEKACKAVLNFLDIENRTKIQFCPSQIVLQDASTKLEARIQHDKGKVESKWTAEQWKEFFILSLKNSISTIHVDTGATVTWILILEGRKMWYFPQHVTAQTVRWLSQAGSQHPEDYEGDWVKVELRPGDLLVMPPSFPHAVYTPENCLTVGGQTYTTGNLSRSIEGLKVQEDYPDISNEDLYDSVYRTLAKLLRECGPITTSVEKAQIASSCSLFPAAPAFTEYDKLLKPELMEISKSRGVAFSSRANKLELLEILKEHDRKTSGTQMERTPREEFLTAAQTFCREHMEQTFG